ncbi:trypsin-like peptidase domain-containing protein [Paludicola sp. MB14-C6]|uniref:S1C family serine protease n=1 Tax=Paludihabitans sp. MB14-C6 TaxID=3070656 RepID=UPI0027DC58A3|nr:trypsin-like peptidase domain-containing protein [Paludicola sp. MB14-C6]WMJ23808.1 trypsin-like peptidase domain-containing protein [Paludicola sp. MB14-C6]
MSFNDNNDLFSNNNQNNNGENKSEQPNTNPTYHYSYPPKQNDTNNPQQPPQQPYSPNFTTPPQQTQWTFEEYGPLDNKNGKKKKDKKEKKPVNGLKVFAIIVSILCIASLGTLGGYIIYDKIDENGSSVQGKGDAPTLDIQGRPEGSKQETTSPDGRLTTQAVNKIVNPSVVGIVTYTKTTGYQVLGQGSGVIMTKDGYIVTNHHVITPEDPRMRVAKIEVITTDKKTYTAKVIGSDSKTDLAVIKVDANNLPAATFGDSSKLEVGETVIAIGNPNGMKFSGSLTKGAVSAVDRVLDSATLGDTMKYIQTDAAINPGNSGGALANEYGQVIGINTAKIVAEGFEGMGFSIPINTAKPIVDSLMKNGYVRGRVRIGITYMPISQTLADLNGIPKGLRVVDFDPNADIAAKGIQKGDIISKINGKEVYDATTISAALDGKKPGDTVEMDIYRIGSDGRAKTFKISIALGEDAPTTSE